jgi:hypothetical protein
MADKRFPFPHAVRAAGVPLTVAATALHLCPATPHHEPADVVEHAPHRDHRPAPQRDRRFTMVNSTSGVTSIVSSDPLDFTIYEGDFELFRLK